ncbi:efflux RND transporter periplasmic adaptor subunit, partial [Mycobacterium tuberculosis]|nr:efflux RND transporter periplasmic adaptor subunit [Mycobacterium tuberculosis]
MGLPDTSPVPKKDPMGMDYVPVYADEAAAASTGVVSVSADKVQKLGVRTEPATRRPVGRAVRAVGTVAVDERREFVVAPKVTGWIEVLKADTTGAPVKRGDVLMEVYSPELTAAEQELLAARRVRADLPDATLYR